MALSSTPCFFAHLWLMTLVHAINAATIVSVGVGPMLVPSRSLGSSMTALTSRTKISVREWVGQFPPNALRDGGLLFHSNHDVAPVVSIGVIEIRDGSHLRQLEAHCLIVGSALRDWCQPSTVQVSHSRIRNNAAKPPQVGHVEIHRWFPTLASPHGSNNCRQLTTTVTV